MITNEQLLGRISSGSGLETENTAMGFRCDDHEHILSAKVGTNFYRQAAIAQWV
jgi:hypothetical protein